MVKENKQKKVTSYGVEKVFKTVEMEETTDNFLIIPMNCEGKMTLGRPRNIKERFPEVYEEYNKLLENVVVKENLLGKAFLVGYKQRDNVEVEGDPKRSTDKVEESKEEKIGRSLEERREEEKDETVEKDREEDKIIAGLFVHLEEELGGQNVSMKALKDSLQKISIEVKNRGIQSVSMPYQMGWGLSRWKSWRISRWVDKFFLAEGVNVNYFKTRQQEIVEERKGIINL